jgi:hypothetical protein
VGLTEIPVSGIRKFLELAQHAFRSRCAKAYIINSGWMLRNAWYVISSCLEQTSRDKTVFLGNDYKEQLAELIGKENLEEKYGGYLPNKTANFFPPDLNVEG